MFVYCVVLRFAGVGERNPYVLPTCTILHVGWGLRLGLNATVQH